MGACLCKGHQGQFWSICMFICLLWFCYVYYLLIYLFFALSQRYRSYSGCASTCCFDELVSRSCVYPENHRRSLWTLSYCFFFHILELGLIIYPKIFEIISPVYIIVRYEALQKPPLQLASFMSS